MSPHKTTYFEFFDLHEGDFLADAIDGTTAVDIHAIDPSCRGGNEDNNRIENLVPLNRRNHETFGGKVQYKSMLYKLAFMNLFMKQKEFDMEWLLSQIKKYEV